MADFWRFLAERLREPSTWRGLVWALTASGIALKPEQVDAIIAVGMALAGLIGVFSSEKPARVEITMPVAKWADEGSGIEPLQFGDEPRLNAMRAPVTPLKRPVVPPRPPQDAA